MFLLRLPFAFLIVICEPLFYILDKMASLGLGVNGNGMVIRARGWLYSWMWNCRQLKVDANIQMIKPTLFTIGNHVKLYAGGHYITSSKGGLQIGDHTHVGRNTVLSGNGGIKIGTHCAISSNVLVYSVSNDFKRTDVPIVEQHKKAAVTIGNNVLLGAGCVVLPGITIGDNAVVGAGAIVSKDVPSGAIVAGNPMKVIRTREL